MVSASVISKLRGRLRRAVLLAAVLLPTGLCIYVLNTELRSGRLPGGAEVAPGLPAPARPLPLGGFRALAADFAWLSAHHAWERRDPAAAAHWCRLTVRIDPRPRYFWINAARLLAYDLADERIRAAGGPGHIPTAHVRRINGEQAGLALDLLAAAQAVHPGDPLLLIEAGNIHLNRCGDLESAAAAYGQAVRHPRAPLYARRIQAALLWQLGDHMQALASLRHHHDQLVAQGSSTDPLLLAGVRARIEVMQQELQLTNE